jgi:hypothetical protein
MKRRLISTLSTPSGKECACRPARGWQASWSLDAMGSISLHVDSKPLIRKFVFHNRLYEAREHGKVHRVHAQGKQKAAVTLEAAEAFTRRSPGRKINVGFAAECTSARTRSSSARLRCALRQGSKPNTATELGVPTKTLPSATVGVIYLLPAPRWSLPVEAWLLL